MLLKSCKLMVKTIKDEEGKVISYMEYYRLNGNTMFDNNGKYIFVHYCWAHESLNISNVIRYYLQEVIAKINNVYVIYWIRGKYNNRRSVYGIKRLDNGRVKLVNIRR